MRLIDADTLKDYIKVWNVGEGIGDNHSEILKAVDRQPTIEAVPVVHGEWIEVYDENYETWYYDCSKCGDGFATKEKCQSLPNFCGECGADMRKVGAEWEK